MGLSHYYSLITEEDIFTSSLQLVSKNKTMIKKEFFKLKEYIAGNLSKVNIDTDDFHDYVEDVFDASGSIPEASSISTIFKTLTKKRFWDFLDISRLESIVEMFSGDLEGENIKMIKMYKANLAGFKVATKIKDLIAANKEIGSSDDTIDEHEQKYDKKYLTDLSLKLFQDKKASIKLSLQSLKYIDKLWSSLCEEFHMPSLPHLLDKIVEGCIAIHWVVHHNLVFKLLEGVSGAVEFFEREVIVNVCVQEVCVYSHETGVVNHKVKRLHVFSN